MEPLRRSTEPVEPPRPPDRLAILLRVGIFGFLAIVCLMVFGTIVRALTTGPSGQSNEFFFIGSVMAVFASAAIANGVSLRIHEGSRMTQVGLAWSTGARRTLFAGIGMGAVAAVAVMLVPVVFGLASLEFKTSPQWPSLLFVSAVLLFGAFGEELLFHGYAFQVLVRTFGAFSTILPVSILFGLAHMGNNSATILGILNTILWGVLLGFAYVRTGTLWLPIGLHYGWNWALPLFGVKLSGFTISVTGLTVRWNSGVLVSGGDYGPEGSLLTTAIVVVLFYMLWRAPLGQAGRYDEVAG
ncbi:MAG: CPBP family intramembrane glutamic endopeptidase [Bryobacteraceae bacterium]